MGKPKDWPMRLLQPLKLEKPDQNRFQLTEKQLAQIGSENSEEMEVFWLTLRREQIQARETASHMIIH